jgi:hypothetical protein
MAVRMPEKLTSIPLTTYGSSTYFFPLNPSQTCMKSVLLFCHLFNVITWAWIITQINYSSESIKTISYSNINCFPKDPISVDVRFYTGISLRYLFNEYAITWVFPPLTYNTTGSFAPVTHLPISISVR